MESLFRQGILKTLKSLLTVHEPKVQVAACKVIEVIGRHGMKY